MPKTKKVYICSNCGYESLKWAGKCPECGRWNSFEETEISASPKGKGRHENSAAPHLLSEIGEDAQERLNSGIGELDRVLGGGIFPASVVLIAGDPGIGKSTLLLQLSAALTKNNVSVLYVSGEESLQQVRNRAQRLGFGQVPLLLLAETELENILYQIEATKPELVVIDSIQSIFSREIGGAPGNVGQVRECASRLFRAAKESNRCLFLVGHITKDGGIAGPKLLEHTVDVVIYFEGDNLYQYRILRALKNRFGAANEMGLFQMEREGLKEVNNPSVLFLSDDRQSKTGSSVVCSFGGSRPILAEVQALVSRSNYGVPQRTVSGFDHRRLALLLAILEKHCGLTFGYLDVFIKIAGGLRIDDPGIDLGIAAAVYSSTRDEALPESSIFIGEIGLNGEIRPVTQLERRIGEAAKLGFKNIYIPQAGGLKISVQTPAGFRLREMKHISEIVRPLQN
jgi:DNA repair protein RadA/Sms